MPFPNDWPESCNGTPGDLEKKWESLKSDTTPPEIAEKLMKELVGAFVPHNNLIAVPTKAQDLFEETKKCNADRRSSDPTVPQFPTPLPPKPEQVT